MVLAAALALASLSGNRAEPSFADADKKTIVLDAGHGDPDGGAIGATGSVESTLNLSVAKKLKSKLEKKGFTVIMTREDENGIHSEATQGIREKKREDMHKRLEIANGSDADLFVSIHMNQFNAEKYRGAEVLYSDRFENALLLAELIQARLKELDPENQTRSVKKADGSIFLLKNAEIPAVLVECGFLSNPAEEKLLKSEGYQKKVAEAIAGGVEEYYACAGERSKKL